MIQQYVDGINIYIPRKREEDTGLRRTRIFQTVNLERDTFIYHEYLAGVSVKELVGKYYLSDKSIWRIIRNMRKEG